MRPWWVWAAMPCVQELSAEGEPQPGDPAKRTFPSLLPFCTRLQSCALQTDALLCARACA
ncbi:hypothetical protein EON67_02440 [archaeon]|nr:MAG: hypothetical protein EON67_02440 [archaeon]